MSNIISYGFGKEYLPNWKIKDGLREVFQNYIDYGKYKIKILAEDDLLVRLEISNNYKPKSLEFLRIGNSNKGSNKEAIGHHGEGLKVAFLVFLKEQLHFTIRYNNYILFPKWEHNELIGDSLTIVYKECKPDNKVKFKTILECPKDIFNLFILDIIKDDDIIFNHNYGSIVDRPIGNIYSRGLFVANIPNLSYSYDIKPSNLQLDRDRCVPSDWDICYYTSQISTYYDELLEKAKTLPVNASYSRPNVHINYNAKDYSYTSSVTETVANEFKLTKVGNNVEFVIIKTNEVLKNDNLKKALLNVDKFKKQVTKTSKQLYKERFDDCKKKSVLTLIRKYKKEHCKTNSEIADIDIIITMVKLDDTMKKVPKFKIR